MAKQIAKLLKADIQDTSDLKSIARMLAKKGRGGDTMLAHITPKEATILKEAGGAGTVNPDTGLLEFYDGFDFDSSSYYTPRASSFDTDTYYRSPSQPQTYEVPAPDIVESYTPAGQSYNLMQFGSRPNVQTGGYEQVDYTPAGAPAIDFTQMGGAYDPRTGGMTGYATPYTFEGRPSAFPISEEAAAVSPLISPPSTAIAPTPPSLAERALTKAGEFYDKLTPADVLRLAASGAGAVAGRQQSQQAARQIQQAVQEQKDVGAPYQKRGRELQEAAMRGELTPQSAQAYQALQAQLRQGAESRGGVGVAQAQAQLEAFRQSLLQNQYEYGLKISSIGDQYALGAIRTGMQLDQQLSQANQQFYTQLAALAGGGTYGYQPPQIPR
jgi:hypothetical protein